MENKARNFSKRMLGLKKSDRKIGICSKEKCMAALLIQEYNWPVAATPSTTCREDE